MGKVADYRETASETMKAITNVESYYTMLNPVRRSIVIVELKSPFEKPKDGFHACRVSME